MTLASVRAAAGGASIPLVEHVRLSREDRARIEAASVARAVRDALEAGGHRTLRAVVSELAARGDAVPGSSEEWA